MVAQALRETQRETNGRLASFTVVANRGEYPPLRDDAGVGDIVQRAEFFRGDGALNVMNRGVVQRACRSGQRENT